MTRSRGDHRSLERLAGLQRLVLSERRADFAERRLRTDDASARERLAEKRQAAATSAIEEMFAEPRLCVDRLILATHGLSEADRALEQSRRSTETASGDEAHARARVARTEQRLRLRDKMARDLARKDSERRDRDGIAETVAIKLTSGKRL